MTAPIRKTDPELRHDVEQELVADPRLNTTELGVGVRAGVVTLTGTVDAWARRDAAQQAAHRVAGVRDVANEIQVHVPGTPGRTDGELAHAVRTALQWDVLVPDEQIRSTVSNGVVTLEGEVDHLTQRDDAGWAVQRLAGVIGVANHVTVKRSVTGDLLRSALRSALVRRLARDADDLRLDVDEGHVSVTGVVGSWSEKQAVLAAVRGTPGVRGVEDHVTIGF